MITIPTGLTKSPNFGRPEGGVLDALYAVKLDCEDTYSKLIGFGSDFSQLLTLPDTRDINADGRFVDRIYGPKWWHSNLDVFYKSWFQTVASKYNATSSGWSDPYHFDLTIPYGTDALVLRCIGNVDGVDNPISEPYGIKSLSKDGEMWMLKFTDQVLYQDLPGHSWEDDTVTNRVLTYSGDITELQEILESLDACAMGQLGLVKLLDMGVTNRVGYSPSDIQAALGSYISNGCDTLGNIVSTILSMGNLSPRTILEAIYGVYQAMGAASVDQDGSLLFNSTCYSTSDLFTTIVTDVFVSLASTVASIAAVCAGVAGIIAGSLVQVGLTIYQGISGVVAKKTALALNNEAIMPFYAQPIFQTKVLKSESFNMARIRPDSTGSNIGRVKYTLLYAGKTVTRYPGFIMSTWTDELYIYTEAYLDLSPYVERYAGKIAEYVNDCWVASGRPHSATDVSYITMKETRLYEIFHLNYPTDWPSGDPYSPEDCVSDLYTLDDAAMRHRVTCAILCAAAYAHVLSNISFSDYNTGVSSTATAQYGGYLRSSATSISINPDDVQTYNWTDTGLMSFILGISVGFKTEGENAYSWITIGQILPRLGPKSATGSALFEDNQGAFEMTGAEYTWRCSRAYLINTFLIKQTAAEYAESPLLSQWTGPISYGWSDYQLKFRHYFNLDLNRLKPALTPPEIDLQSLRSTVVGMGIAAGALAVVAGVAGFAGRRIMKRTATLAQAKALQARNEMNAVSPGTKDWQQKYSAYRSAMFKYNVTAKLGGTTGLATSGAVSPSWGSGSSSAASSVGEAIQSVFAKSQEATDNSATTVASVNALSGDVSGVAGDVSDALTAITNLANDVSLLSRAVAEIRTLIVGPDTRKQDHK